MKRICTLLTALSLGLFLQAQEVTRTATASKQSSNGGVEDWGTTVPPGPPPPLHTALESNNNIFAYANLDFTSITAPNQGKADTASEYLVLTGFNLNLPADAIIGRISVNFWGRSDGDTAVIYLREVQLVSGVFDDPGTMPNRGFTSFDPTFTGKRSDTALAFGEPNEGPITFAGAPAAYWGSTITAAQANSPGFGVAFRVANTHPTEDVTAYIDSVSITVLFQAGTITPVTFVNVSAKPAANGTQITWNVADEIDVKEYQVERSEDGTNFGSIGSVAAGGKSSYSFLDRKPVQGTIYYRIKNVDLNGEYKYSTVISYKNGGSAVLLKAFPLPTRGALTLQHNAALGQSLITISAQDGKVVKQLRPSTGSTQTPIDLSGLNAGLYLLRYDDGKGQVETLKVLKQ